MPSEFTQVNDMKPIQNKRSPILLGRSISMRVMEQTEGVLLMHCVVVMCIVFYYYAACLSKGLYTRTLLGLAF